MTAMLGARCATGPGGRDCACCGQAPGHAREAARRTVKRSERQQVQREIDQESDPSFAARSVIDAWLTHAVFDGERCIECGVNTHDAMLYDIACHPDREPVVYTTETP